MKHQSPSTHCSKVISKVKVFKKWVTVQKLNLERRTELLNDRQYKNNLSPDLRSRGHKNSYYFVSEVPSTNELQEDHSFAG